MNKPAFQLLVHQKIRLIPYLCPFKSASMKALPPLLQMHQDDASIPSSSLIDSRAGMQVIHKLITTVITAFRASLGAMRPMQRLLQWF